MEKYGRAWIVGLAAAAAALMLFGYLAHAVLRHQTVAFDSAIRDGIHAWATPGLTGLMRGITLLGSPPVLVALGVILVWRLAAGRRWKVTILLLVASAGAEVLDQVLKLAFHRPRPEFFFDVAALGYSFPSGHSVVCSCFFGVAAAILSRRLRSRSAKAALWAAAALLVLLVGVSRIYLGVHYPSDVLAGYAAAVIWVAAVRAGYEVWLRRQAGVTAGSSS